MVPLFGSIAGPESRMIRPVPGATSRSCHALSQSRQSSACSLIAGKASLVVLMDGHTDVEHQRLIVTRVQIGMLHSAIDVDGVHFLEEHGFINIRDQLDSAPEDQRKFLAVVLERLAELLDR